MNLKYRADIDGLRGVAVAAVVTFHLQLGLTGGYVGVDVFFVISGFLITRLILDAQREERFSLKEFWVRRVRRLAPAALAMTIGTLLAAGWFMYPEDFRQFSKSLLAQLLLASNFYFCDMLDYFAGPAELQPLLHTWSLAVEEQFYLVFPLLLMLLRKLSPRRQVTVLASIAVLSFVWSVFQVATRPAPAFFLLPFRAWELLAGALLVYVPPLTRRHASMWECASLLGFAGIIISFVAFDSGTPFPGTAALLPVLSTALLLFANGQHATWIGRRLAWQPLVGLGLISYSLYLWHWPVISLMHYYSGETLSPAATASALLASLGLGYASWRWIETPVRYRRVLKPDGVLLRASFVALLLLATIAGTSLVTRGIPIRWGREVTAALANSSHEMSRFRTGNPSVPKRDRLPEIGKNSSDSPATVLIWGDSHAAQIGQICDELAKRHGVRGFVASRNGFAPILGTWRWNRGQKVTAWNDEVLEYVRRNKVQHVILVSRWAGYMRIRDNRKNDTLIADEDSKSYTIEDAQRVMAQGVRRTVESLQEAGAQVWVFKQVPKQANDPISELITCVRNNETLIKGVSLAEYEQQQEFMTELLNSLPDVNLIDPTRTCFDANGDSKVGTSSHSYYIDCNHLSTVGARELVGPVLEPIFAQIGSQTLRR